MSFRPKSDLMPYKANYFQEAAKEAKATHPEELPSMLICPISGDFMEQPVITPQGKVYDKKFILKHLETKQEDPQTRTELKAKNLKDFSELSEIIKEFKQKKENYLKEKNAFIQQVREVVNQEVLPEKPLLFLCPISHELIKNPVITSKGKVYDRDSLSNYLHCSNNSDEEGQPLTISEVVLFTEFKEQLKLFQFRLAKQQQQKEVEPTLSSSPLSFITGFISSFFGKDDDRHDDANESHPKFRK